MKPGGVLHVLPADAFRGAQTYARELRTRLDSDATNHRTLVLFRSAGGSLQPDFELGVRAGGLRRAGLDPRAVVRLRRFVRNEAPTVVVAHGGEPLKYLVAAGVPRRRIAYYKIGAFDAKLTGARRVLHQRLLRRVAVAAAVSEGAAEEARTLGVPSDRVVVIPNGRDVSLYAARGSGAPAAVAGGPQLVFVGHFDNAKRPERFIELVQALRGSGRTIRATMAGDGPRLAGLRDAARTADVELLGNVTDVPSLLGRSDLFVFTGGPPEGMPGVLIEAGLAGLAVVTTDVPGARDVIDDGTTGRVVPIDDFAALVTAASDLVDDPVRRAALGAAARVRCEARFGLEASVQQWRVVLEKMLAELCASST